MKDREESASGHAAGQSLRVRLPYRSPSLVEYGNVSKLTEGAHGSQHDVFGMNFSRPCL